MQAVEVDAQRHQHTQANVMKQTDRQNMCVCVCVCIGEVRSNESSAFEVTTFMALYKSVYYYHCYCVSQPKGLL